MRSGGNACRNLAPENLAGHSICSGEKPRNGVPWPRVVTDDIASAVSSIKLVARPGRQTELAVVMVECEGVREAKLASAAKATVSRQSYQNSVT